MGRLQLKIPPLGVVLLFAAAMWLLSRYVKIGVESGQIPVGWRGWLAGVLLITGLAVATSGVYAFRRARTTVDPLRPDKATRLVTGGVYRATRNPMYVGMALLLSAWAVFLGSPPALLLLPLFIAYLNRFQIGPEERILRRKFSGEYEQYCERVRRWL